MHARQPLEITDGLPRRTLAALAGKLLAQIAFLAVALGAFAGYQHFKLHGETAAAWIALLAAGGLALMPVRALLDELLEIESNVMHLIHGVGGLALVGLAGTGVIAGTSVLTRGAMAPFAIMGAAQAFMHADHPRSPEQAAALEGFVASLPELHAVASGDLASPAHAERAIAVISKLVAQAQRIGETELRADPGFQGALQQVTTRTGVTLGLDAIDHALGALAENPAAAAAVPRLRRELAKARLTLSADPPRRHVPRTATAAAAAAR
jgi:hypothetical protein